jgi:hypothetical protein
MLNQYSEEACKRRETCKRRVRGFFPISLILNQYSNECLFHHMHMTEPCTPPLLYTFTRHKAQVKKGRRKNAERRTAVRAGVVTRGKMQSAALLCV